jgi:hypothetical protein
MDAPRSPIALASLAELNMGRVLRPLVLLASAIAFYFHLRQFIWPDFGLRYNPDEAYITLLAAYSGHRELKRWSQDPEVITQTGRRGELFVVFWWAFYFVTLAAANEVARYRLPDGLLSLCVQITAIFFGTLTSQHLFKGKQGKEARVGEEASAGDQTESQILAHIQGSKELVRHQPHRPDRRLPWCEAELTHP